ncbi:hypothetical protein I4F81_009769 [Pyropia yezoensis]|uniref:Uncharacterized protein n=1 Tax=Pyropia yezoensis TaxID=2788 RepID=A0ACC3CAR9_PYRYE|nr:hypothetical protein I4F81_009769 [Neopyropia yezoensis]
MGGRYQIALTSSLYAALSLPSGYRRRRRPPARRRLSLSSLPPFPLNGAAPPIFSGEATAVAAVASSCRYAASTPRVVWPTWRTPVFVMYFFCPWKTGK